MGLAPTILECKNNVLHVRYRATCAQQIKHVLARTVLAGATP